MSSAVHCGALVWFLISKILKVFNAHSHPKSYPWGTLLSYPKSYPFILKISMLFFAYSQILYGMLFFAYSQILLYFEAKLLKKAAFLVQIKTLLTINLSCQNTSNKPSTMLLWSDQNYMQKYYFIYNTILYIKYYTILRASTGCEMNLVIARYMLSVCVWWTPKLNNKQSRGTTEHTLSHWLLFIYQL